MTPAKKAPARKRRTKADRDLEAIAVMLGISDDPGEEVPDHVLVSVGELSDPPDEDEVS